MSGLGFTASVSVTASLFLANLGGQAISKHILDLDDKLQKESPSQKVAKAVWDIFNKLAPPLSFRRRIFTVTLPRFCMIAMITSIQLIALISLKIFPPSAVIFILATAVVYPLMADLMTQDNREKVRMF